MPEKLPMVSIGMPVYNGGRWLSFTIESLLQQTFQDFELIIVDNASMDDTKSICQHYASKDPRVRYYRNETNIGSSENYNVAFKYSQGKYFKWASANDYCESTLIEKCVAVLEDRSDAVLCYAKTRLIDDEGRVIEDYHDDLDLQYEDAGKRFVEMLNRMRLNNVMNGLIRADILKKTPLMKKHISEDINLMAELTLYGKFIEVPEYLFYRRISDNSSTSIKHREKLLRHYDPDNTSLMIFQEWKIYLDYCTAMLRAPLSNRQKLSLLMSIVKMGVMDKKLLGKDIVDSVKKLLTISFHSGSLIR